MIWHGWPLNNVYQYLHTASQNNIGLQFLGDDDVFYLFLQKQKIVIAKTVNLASFLTTWFVTHLHLSGYASRGRVVLCMMCVCACNLCVQKFWGFPAPGVSGCLLWIVKGTFIIQWNVRVAQKHHKRPWNSYQCAMQPKKNQKNHTTRSKHPHREPEIQVCWSIK